MTYKTLIDHFESLCEKEGKSIFIVKYMIMELSRLETHVFYTALNDTLEEAFVEQVKHAMHQYIYEHIPVDYILGYRYFYGHKFHVNHDVLIPRNETEKLVERVMICLDYMQKPVSVLDLGTGSGCIGLTLKKEVEGITVTLADISFEALDVAKSNGESLEVDVHYIQSDWFSNIDQVFDVIVCNPPYIPDDELIGDTVDKEPNLALFGGKTGLEHYETVIAQSKTFLQSNGLMAFEHGYNQKEALHQIILTHYENASIVTLKDFEDKDRMTFFSPNNKKLMKEGLR
ncbi:MAG TPA: peptide chain release factor N(5)-glutamine methyltransferase [Acholeplasmataceae bacterium]|nr:peptide chain release factor N(5)-glutamine methyltransferase [Acholeplasmataceae bacterium]